MGLLRLYLAFCVISTHTGSIIPWPIQGGEEAVEIFFMISGFYMSLVALKYTSTRQFYVSRLLRIFSSYWITLGFIIAISIGFGIFSGNNWLVLNPYVYSPLDKNGFMGIFLTAFTNLTLFFQDWIMFLTQDYGKNLAFTSNFRGSTQPLYQYLLIPQAWTVSIELVFYLLFPFLNKLKNKTLVIILIASVLVRIFTYEVLKLNTDPWNYRFFPFEIAFFVLGMLSFRVYSVSPIGKTSSPAGNAMLYVLLIPVLLFLFVKAKLASTIIAQHAGLEYMEYARLSFYLVWAFAIPLLFHIFKRSEIDRFIGELSYPTYLIHLTVLALIRSILSMYGLSPDQSGIFIAVVSICWAIGFYVIIIKRLDVARSKIVSRQI